MISRVIAFAFPVLVVVGCRGIVGIEELTLAPDGGTDGSTVGTTDSGADVSTSVDAAVEAAVDSGLAPITVPTTCNAGADCPKCCRETLALQPQFAKLEEIGRNTMCLCQGAGALCATQCVDKICANPPPAGGSGPTCGPCVDDAFTTKTPTPACKTASDTCLRDVECASVITCIKSCRP